MVRKWSWHCPFLDIMMWYGILKVLWRCVVNNKQNCLHYMFHQMCLKLFDQGVLDVVSQSSCSLWFIPGKSWSLLKPHCNMLATATVYTICTDAPMCWFSFFRFSLINLSSNFQWWVMSFWFLMKCLKKRH